jgi:hypothetical protein
MPETKRAVPIGTARFAFRTFATLYSSDENGQLP